jgi:LysM repeat protein
MWCRRARERRHPHADYAASITDRVAWQYGGDFRNGASTPTQYANFDLSLDQTNSYNQGSSGGAYIVREGDTLASIAANLWGDSSLWYKIAEANGLTGQSTVAEGQVLNLPTGVNKSTHNAKTFNPYDPNDVVGDTSPTPAQPKPKKAKCGGIGTIILVIIAVVVTIYTAGAAAGVMGALANGAAGGVLSGAMAGGAAAFTGGLGAAVVAGGGAGLVLTTAGAAVAGAIGGAMGSIVSQGIGVATGIQDKFSWNAVGMAAVGGALGAGSKLGVGGKSWVAEGLRGAVRNVATQGIGVAWLVAVCELDTGLDQRLLNRIDRRGAAREEGAVLRFETLDRLNRNASRRCKL